jgi:hypothetical protein
VFEFEKIKPGISPAPLVGWVVVIPPGDVLDHANVVPDTELVRCIVELELPEQKTCV